MTPMLLRIQMSLGHLRSMSLSRRIRRHPQHRNSPVPLLDRNSPVPLLDRNSPVPLLDRSSRVRDLLRLHRLPRKRMKHQL